MRFCLLVACLLGQLTAVLGQSGVANPVVTPRMRVIVDNDFSGDPDGLFQLAHLILSPSVEVRALIGSHLRAGDGFDRSAVQAQNAATQARELLRVMKMGDAIPVMAGSNTAMLTDSTPVRSAGVDAIIREARRTDTKLPLYVLCGAGLTEVSSALHTAPDIADKFTLVWIGGPEYADLALPPPGYTNPEYNLNIDPAAARVVFNQSGVRLWQVPRNAYRQAIIAYAQLRTQVKPHAPVGTYLANILETLMIRLRTFVNTGETYILGDSPLVLLTALQSSFEADPSSSEYVIRQAPLIDERGNYAYNPGGRPIRVYTRLDTYLMFSDFFAKLQLMGR